MKALITTPRRGRGRPATGRTRQQVKVYMRPDVIEAAKAATGEGESLSDLVESAVETEIKRRARKVRVTHPDRSTT